MVAIQKNSGENYSMLIFKKIKKYLQDDKRTIPLLLLGIGIVFLLFGLYRGEAAIVLTKAIRICLECIGIG